MSKPQRTSVPQPARHYINVLGQWFKFIPRRLIDKAAKETGADAKARTYTVLSHRGTMIFEVRDGKFAELVFWRTLAHLQHCDRSFGCRRPGGSPGRTLLHHFKVRIHAVDLTVMELLANCLNWVTRAKGNMCWCSGRNLPVNKGGRALIGILPAIMRGIE